MSRQSNRDPSKPSTSSPFPSQSKQHNNPVPTSQQHQPRTPKPHNAPFTKSTRPPGFLLDFDPRAQIPPWVPLPDPLGIMSIDANGNVKRRSLSEVDFSKHSDQRSSRRMTERTGPSQSEQDAVEQESTEDPTKNKSDRSEQSQRAHAESSGGSFGNSDSNGEGDKDKEQRLRLRVGMGTNQDMYYREQYFRRQKYMAEEQERWEHENGWRGR